MNKKIKAVFFDLDGTLLPMDQDKFAGCYFSGLHAYATRNGILDCDIKAFAGAMNAGTRAMISNDGSCTTAEAFWKVFNSTLGENVSVNDETFEEFYKTEFEAVRPTCGYTEKAEKVIDKVKQSGRLAILATNPFFPAICTHARVRWAGLTPKMFSYITTYENSNFCKPNPKYFVELTGKLGLNPDECVMIGNDTSDDLSAREIGMDVFILTDCLINKDNIDLSDIPHGSWDELEEYLLKCFSI